MRLAQRGINAAFPFGLWDFITQLGVLSGAFFLYSFTRVVVRGAEATAMRNANAIMHVERTLGVFREPWLQAKVSHVEPLLRVFNWFWSNVHLPIMLGCLLWLYFAHRERFGFFRNWFLTMNLIGVAMYALLPTAPPRLVPSSGVVDTLFVLSPHSVQWGINSSTANPYAAMPSLHMAYALFVACALIGLTRSRWLKVLFAVYPVFMFFAIIVTGNHWFLDALGGALVTCVAYVFCAQVSYGSMSALQPADVLARRTGQW